MIGSPGTGKTLLSQRLCTILPELESEESLETTQIYSAVGRLAPGQPLLLRRPFRSPHHTISQAGLVGGGSTPQPGDFEYEFQMVGMNRALDDSIETVFLMAEAKHQAIASKLVKEIARLGGDVSKFVTPMVNDALKERFG